MLIKLAPKEVINLLIPTIFFVVLSCSSFSLLGSKTSIDLDEIGVIYTAIGVSIEEASNVALGEGDISATLSSILQGGSLSPAGFVLIESLMSKVSKTLLWMSILPLTFFFLTIFITIHGLKAEKMNLLSSTAVLSFIFLNDAIMNMSVFIRPYSMEYCGYALLFVLPSISKKSWIPRLKPILIYSRYALALHSAIDYIVRRDYQKNSFIKETLIFIPLIIIFWFQKDFHEGTFSGDIFLHQQSMKTIIYNLLDPRILNLLICPFLYIHLTGRWDRAVVSWFILISLIALDLISVSPLASLSRYSLGPSLYGFLLQGFVFIKLIHHSPIRQSIYSLAIILSSFFILSFKPNSYSDTLAILTNINRNQITNKLFLSPMAYAEFKYLTSFEHSFASKLQKIDIELYKGQRNVFLLKHNHQEMGSLSKKLILSGQSSSLFFTK